MRFLNINLNNFRQYYGSVDIDLETNSKSNIILIGGRNGYGKTNLLLSVVWCLYGEKISQIDDNYKSEIKKVKNYQSFMQESINKTAKSNNKNIFSVSITISDIELPEINENIRSTEYIYIERTFNTTSMTEDLSICYSKNGNEIFEEYSDKVNFINDYIIPIDAAKFVFFDAEKISEIANFSIKEEGSFINDALGKILGLDVYESLIEDIDNYITSLKKEGAKKNLQAEIINREKAIEISKIDVDELEVSNAEKNKKIDILKKSIREYDNIISQYSKHANSSFNREELLLNINNLEEQKKELSLKFTEQCEIIPLTILTGKLEEVNHHLKIQDKNLLHQIATNDNRNRLERFIELLFNKPPEPDDTTLSFSDKMFYYNKAKTLGSELFDSSSEMETLEFLHDLNISDTQLISDALTLVNTQSKEGFESTIKDLNIVENKLEHNLRILKKVDADIEDELILEYSTKKEKAERDRSIEDRNIGVNNEKISKLKNDIIKLGQQYKTLINKVEINQKNKIKISKSNEYLSVLKSFVYEQKELKKESLAQNILKEMQKLMHKLCFNKSQFITDVKVSILAEGMGMKISLYNSDDEEIRKETLSQGEKQLYISSLIKAILKESVQSLPIFIDTPLGRLDDEHIKNILLYYYPNLSEQVVLLSTNNEITPKRYKDISSNISKSYLLQFDGADTSVVKGYFNTENND